MRKRHLRNDMWFSLRCSLRRLYPCGGADSEMNLSALFQPTKQDSSFIDTWYLLYDFIVDDT
jgi:hypothetical protein